MASSKLDILESGFATLDSARRHAETPQALERYKVEPYVACADVYSVDPHVGRGGWTWYTRSAAWLYRAGLEAMLGFGLQHDRLLVDPCIPRAWPGFTIRYRYGTSRCVIEVRKPGGVQSGSSRQASMANYGLRQHVSSHYARTERSITSVSSWAQPTIRLLLPVRKFHTTVAAWIQIPNLSTH